MAENDSLKSLALLVTNNTITFLTQTKQNNNIFYSDFNTIDYSSANNLHAIDNLKNTINTNLVLLQSYHKIYICYQSLDFTIVPNLYYKKDLLNKYQFTINTTKYFYSINNSEIDTTFIFKPILPIHEVFTELPNFSNAIYTHSAQVFIKSIIPDKEKIQIFTQLINQKLELCIYNKGIFTLYSIYDVIGDEDALYYIVNAMQQFELNPTEVDVILDQNLSLIQYITTHLPKYVQHVTKKSENEKSELEYLLYKIFECE